jgi:hypothetical protein
VCQVLDPPEWFCAPPRTGCPASAPNPGDPCTEEGLECGPSCELSIVCQGGEWLWQRGECPICASAETPIATPSGERAISTLQVGDVVYSVHRDAIVAVPLLRVASTRVARHQVLRITLDDGRSFAMSAGHPTSDGRRLSDLGPGDSVDASRRVVSVERIPYEHDRTYDVLPASDTGAYFAAGALMGTTLRRPSPGDLGALPPEK